MEDKELFKKDDPTKKIKHSRSELSNLPEEERAVVALRYDIEKDAAPVILAAGRGQMAEDIMDVAEENQIPFYEDKGLADLLLKLEIDTEVPPELFVLVAEVLAFVFKLEQMSDKREKFLQKAQEMDLDEV